MKKSDKQTKELERFMNKVVNLWPVAKGSLCKVRKPCIRPNCNACKKGIKHPAFMFSWTENGKRRCMYVSREFVPVIRKAIKNGRRLEQQMSLFGAALIREYRKGRSAKNVKETHTYGK